MADEELTPAQVLELQARQQGGEVTPEQLLRAKAADVPGARTGNLVKRGVAALVEPATRGVQKVFDLAGELDVAQGIKTPEQAKSRAETYAKFLVPQNTPQLLGQAGMLALGPAGPVARILGSGLLYGAGSALEGDPLQQQALNAGLGAAATAVGEGLTAAGSAAARGLTGMKQKLADRAAGRLGEVADELTTPHPEAVRLQSSRPMGPIARTSEELRDQAAGRLIARAGTDKAAAMQAVEDLLAAQTGPHTLIQPRPAVPGLQGPGYRPTQQATTSTRPTIRVQGEDLTVQAANDKLSQIGALAFSELPADRTFNGIDQRRLYGEVKKEILDQLMLQNPLAGAIWGKGQNAYEAAVGIQDILRRGGAFTPERDRLVGGRGTTLEGVQEVGRGEGGAVRYLSGLLRLANPGIGSHYATRPGTQLNAGTLQAYLQSPQGKDYAVGKFGEQGYQSIMQALFPERLPLELSPQAKALADVLVQDIAATLGGRQVIEGRALGRE